MPGNNRNAVRCQEEGHTFDSLWERQIYRKLRLFLPYGDIRVHHPFVIAPPNDYYPEWAWKCDFNIPKWDIWIEAKGLYERDWLVTMRAINHIYPEFQKKLIVVSALAGRKINKRLYSVDENHLSQWLMNRTSNTNKGQNHDH